MVTSVGFDFRNWISNPSQFKPMPTLCTISLYGDVDFLLYFEIFWNALCINRIHYPKGKKSIFSHSTMLYKLFIDIYYCRWRSWRPPSRLRYNVDGLPKAIVRDPAHDGIRTQIRHPSVTIRPRTHKKTCEYLNEDEYKHITSLGEGSRPHMNATVHHDLKTYCI